MNRQSVTIRLALGSGTGAPTRDGFLVPDTESTLAVDERSPRDWIITHLPSGQRVPSEATRSLTSCVAAIAVAQALYRELTAVGADMKSSDVSAIIGPVNLLPKDGRNAFWARVLS